MKLKNAPARKLQRQIDEAFRSAAYLSPNYLSDLVQARAIRTKKHRAPRASF